MRIMSAPIYVAWNYNYSCNFNCTHCYSRAPWYPKELTTHDYRRVAAEIADMGVFRVSLGGGEPLLREDCFEIICYLSNRGVETNLTTNGWRLNKDATAKLRKSHLNRLYISIDSSNAIQHDHFRRKQGSFKRATKAAALAASEGIEVFFSTVITRLNFQQIEAMANLASHLNVAGIEFKRFRPAGNGVQFESDYKLTEIHARSLLDCFKTLQKSSPVPLTLVNGPETNIGSVETTGCACGVKSICIRPNGDVSPCAYSEIVIGNLQSQNLKDIWVHSDYLFALRQTGGCQALQTTMYPTNPGANVYFSRREQREHINFKQNLGRKSHV